jgi:PTH1 family peptidyl-tRNA hydrolase
LKAIVGLGNPGKAYEGTRHNVGFAVLNELQTRSRIPDWQTGPGPAEALYCVWRRSDDEPVVLAKPVTFMNASGEAVGALLRWFKIDPAELLVVVDEVQLPLGRLRLRPSGSAGGHNGLKSVIAHVGEDFARLRLGVGRGDPKWDLADHVLSRFAADERPVVTAMIEKAADAVQVFVSDGIQPAMNRFNAANDAGAS